jgi:Domain of unknown function (DUF4277)
MYGLADSGSSEGRSHHERDGCAGHAGPHGTGAEAIERLDHLGIVAGICREIGLAAYLDAQDERSHERVSVGTATVAMILNGLGFSNRRLYLLILAQITKLAAGKPALPQSFA